MSTQALRRALRTRTSDGRPVICRQVHSAPNDSRRDRGTRGPCFSIRALRARGIKIGILTNGPSELQRRKLRLIGIEDEVDAVAVSEEIGVSKPDPEAYARAVELLGLAPGEVAMVGDHVVNDVAGALAAGLGAAVWVERRPGEELPEGAHLAQELAEVPALLGFNSDDIYDG